MGIRLTVLVAAALFASPAMASAGQIENAQKVASLYWAERGYSECEGLDVGVRWRQDIDGPGAAHVGLCEVARDCQTGAHQNCYPDGTETAAYISLHELMVPGRAWYLNCQLVVHEYGHLVGLDHDSRWPVMNRMAVPNECRNPTRLQARVRRYERRARGLSRRDHPHRARHFERRARRVSRQADRAAEFRVRAGL